jgi:hypothetical protein
VLEQVGDPFGVLDIGFPPWNGLHMLGVAQQQFHLPFQHIPDAFPLHPGTFHGHGLAALSFEPLAESEEIRHHRAEHLDFTSRTPSAVIMRRQATIIFL